MFTPQSTRNAWSYHHAAAMGLAISSLVEQSQQPRDVEHQTEIERARTERSRSLIAAWQLVKYSSRSRLELVWFAPRPHVSLKAGQS